MKSATAFALLGALVPLVTAHYTFPDITIGGVKSADWQYIRTTANHYSNGPVTDVTSDAIRCYELSPGTPSSTATVSAGSSVTITANTGIYHQGTIAIYMAAASDASSASAGKGQSWFKIYQNVPVWNSGSRQFTFPSTTDATITFTIPKDVPSGQYLLRTEQIALHQASAAGGAQFYISCAQLNVVNGGSGTPGPLVSFPGAYSATDPGIMINIYNPPAGYSGYTPPGPKVWTGGSYSGGGGGQPSNTATSTTATQPASTATATSSTAATSAPTSGSGGAAQWAQCGGSGWSGATSCASPYKCVTLNQYYSQCQ